MPSLDDVVTLRVAPHFAGVLERHGVDALVRGRGDAVHAVAVLDEEIGQIERHFRAVLRRAGDPAWDALLVRFACDCGAYFSLRGRYRERLEWARAGLQAARRVADEQAESILLTGMANIFFCTARFPQALTHYGRAYASSERAGRHADMAVDLANMGRTHEAAGDFAAAAARYGEALEIRERLRDRPGAARLRAALGDLASLQGDLDQARVSYAAALQEISETDDPLTYSRLLANLGTLANKRGAYEEGVVILEASLRIKERVGDERGRAIVLANLGRSLGALGRTAEAEARFRASLALAERLGDEQTRAHQSWNLGCHLEEQGRLAEALPLLEDSVDWCEAVEHPDIAERRALLHDVRTRLGAGTDSDGVP